MKVFIATDGYDLCLWEGAPDDPTPRCVATQPEVDPLVWSLIEAAVFGIPAPANENLDGAS